MGCSRSASIERASGRVFLARDRLGVKPLYLAEVGGALRFASTLPALLAGGGDRHVARPGRAAPLLLLPRRRPGAADDARAACASCRRPRRSRSSRTARARERRYWRARFERDPDRVGWGEAEWAEAVHDALRVAVERRMVSDVPVGVLLSGGLDSSPHRRACSPSPARRGLMTFSVGFGDVGGREGNEFAYSDLVAAALRHRPPDVPASSEERMLEALDAAIAAMSEPMVSHDAWPSTCSRRRSRSTRKVVQSGQGADEVFGGY